jgi:hypothetical protein
VVCMSVWWGRLVSGAVFVSMYRVMYDYVVWCVSSCNMVCMNMQCILYECTVVGRIPSRKLNSCEESRKLKSRDSVPL